MGVDNLSFIVLFYDDGPTVMDLLTHLNTTLQNSVNHYEIIAIDDGSTDNTQAELKNAQKTFPNLKLHFNEKNKGVGYSFRHGVALSRYDYIGYTDGDGQYPPAEIAKLLPHLQPDIIVSSHRFHRADSALRKWASTFYNLLLNGIFNLEISDVNSALKIFPTKAVKGINQSSNGAFFDAEILIKCKAAGFNIKEIPIQHRRRKYGVSKGLQRAHIQEVLKGMISRDLLYYRSAKKTTSFYIFLARLLKNIYK